MILSGKKEDLKSLHQKHDELKNQFGGVANELNFFLKRNMYNLEKFADLEMANKNCIKLKETQNEIKVKKLIKETTLLIFQKINQNMEQRQFLTVMKMIRFLDSRNIFSQKSVAKLNLLYSKLRQKAVKDLDGLFFVDLEV